MHHRLARRDQGRNGERHRDPEHRLDAHAARHGRRVAAEGREARRREHRAGAQGEHARRATRSSPTSRTTRPPAASIPARASAEATGS